MVHPGFTTLRCSHKMYGHLAKPVQLVAIGYVSQSTLLREATISNIFSSGTSLFLASLLKHLQLWAMDSISSLPHLCCLVLSSFGSFFLRPRVSRSNPWTAYSART